MFELEELGSSLIEFPVGFSPVVDLLKELGAPRLAVFRLTWLLEDVPPDRFILCVPWQSVDKARRFAQLVSDELTKRPELQGLRRYLGPYDWVQPKPEVSTVLLFWLGLTGVWRTRH
jgi:hypothetical protein